MSDRLRFQEIGTETSLLLGGYHNRDIWFFGNLQWLRNFGGIFQNLYFFNYLAFIILEATHAVRFSG